MVYSGGTLNVGTAATATNFTFRAQGQAPAVVVDNTTNNKTLVLSGQLNVWGTTTINPGTAVNLTSSTTVGQTLLQIGPSVMNNGAIVVSGNNLGTLNFAGSLQALNGGYAQNYTGTGTFGAAGLRPATLSVQNAPGVTLDPSVSALNVYRVNAFYGPIANSDKITIGAGDAAPHGRPARRDGHPIPGRQPRRRADLQPRHLCLHPRLLPVPGRDDHRPGDPGHTDRRAASRSSTPPASRSPGAI